MGPDSIEPGTLLARLCQPLSIAGVIVVLDQATKLAVSRSLLLGDQVTVFEGFANIVHARNPGAAFSFLANAPDWFRAPFFLAVTVLAILVVLSVLARSGREDWVLRLALGGILGGAVGNLLDRLTHGEVIDFIDVHWRAHHWPAFNVADSAISASVMMIFARSLVSGREDDATGARHGSPP